MPVYSEVISVDDGDVAVATYCSAEQLAWSLLLRVKDCNDFQCIPEICRDALMQAFREYANKCTDSKNVIEYAYSMRGAASDLVSALNIEYGEYFGKVFKYESNHSVRDAIQSGEIPAGCVKTLYLAYTDSWGTASEVAARFLGMSSVGCRRVNSVSCRTHAFAKESAVALLEAYGTGVSASAVYCKIFAQCNIVADVTGDSFDTVYEELVSEFLKRLCMADE